jgi:hypothetical protein
MVLRVAMSQMKTLSRNTPKALVLYVICVLVAMCAPRSACDDWTSHVRQLTTAERAQLDFYGAYAVAGELLFSARVVPNCEIRARFSRFAGNVIQGVNVDRETALAVRANRDQFVAALVKIWPTRNARVPGSDGAFRDELTSLLVTPDVGKISVRPLISKILIDDGVSGEATYALLMQPDPFFLGQLHRSESAPRSLKERLLATVALQRLGEDPRPTLNRLNQLDDLTPTMRTAIRTLLDRYLAHQPPQWEDVIDVASE